MIRSATDDLLKFLEAKLPPYADFLPACVSHTKKVVQGIDAAYTDLQLQSVLENECWLDKKFVTVEDGFDHEQACKKFAKQLMDARMKELDSGSLDGYDEFCKDYYIHKGGVISEVKTEPNAAEVKTEPNAGEVKTEPNATEAEIFDKEFEEQYSKGRSNERARYEAEKKVKEQKDKAAGKKTEKKDAFPIWAAALILGGITAFTLTGLFLQYRK